MKIFSVLLDVLRWIIGLVILFIVLNYTQVSIYYIFEFFVRNLISLNLVFYFLAWVFMVAALMGIVYFIYTIVLTLISFIVKQKKAFSMITGLLFGLGILVNLILFWTNLLTFSWELLPYSKLNKIFYSIYLISFLYLPIAIISIAHDED